MQENVYLKPTIDILSCLKMLIYITDHYCSILQGKRRGITGHYKTDTDQHILLLVQHNSSQDRTIRNLSEKLDQFKELLTIVVGSKETDQIKKI